MPEVTINQDFVLSDFDIDKDIDDETEEDSKVEVILNQRDEKIKVARRIYITTNKSIATIADELNLSKYSLQKIAQKEKWTLLKQNPDVTAWSNEAIEELYTSINFYDEAKARLFEMLYMEQWQNPTDLKKIVETFKMSDEKTTQIRSVVKMQESVE